MHSLFSFWWQGFKEAFSKSWDKYGFALSFFGAVWTVAAIFLPDWIEQRFKGFDMSLWITLGIPGILAIAFMLYHFLKAPYEIYRELYGKMSEDMTKKTAENQHLTTELQAARESMPQLELLPSFSDKDSEGHYYCRVAIRNSSATATAKAVKLELLKIEPNPELRMYSMLTGDVPYPITLRPCEVDGDIIHPGSLSRFDLFSGTEHSREHKTGTLSVYQYQSHIFRTPESLAGKPRFTEVQNGCLLP